MKSEGIAREVAAFEEQKKKLLEELDTLIVTYKDDMARASQNWIQKEVDRQVEYHAELIQTLGVERLKSLKGKVAELIKRLPKLTESEMSDRDKWPHYSKQAPDDYRRDREEPFPHNTIRNLISHLGPILDEFGMVTAKKGHSSSWEKDTSGRVRFAINPGFFKTFQTTALTQYQTITKQYDTLRKQLARKKEELDKAKARELWDSA